MAQHALEARARPLLRGFALLAVQSQWRATPFGGAAGHLPPQGRGRAELPQPGAALQHPLALCREIASVVNARVVTHPASSYRLLGLLQSFHPRLQPFANAPQRSCQLAVVQGQKLLAAPHRLSGDSAVLQVLGQEAQPVLLVYMGPIVALRRGPVENGLQLVQISVPDVLLDLLVGEVVLAISRVSRCRWSPL